MLDVTETVTTLISLCINKMYFFLNFKVFHMLGCAMIHASNSLNVMLF